MVAKSILMYVLLIVLPDLYIYLHYLRHHKHFTWWKTILWWMPCVLLLAYTAFLFAEPNFAPDDQSVLFWFLMLFGLLAVPKAAFAVCSFIGWRWCRWWHKRRNWGNLLGLGLALFCIYVVIYGSTIGFSKLEVRHIEYTSSAVPNAFDGYKIVLFSDAHVGSYSGRAQRILARAIDSINAQRADAIVFAGDLQNIHPQELYEHRSLLGSLRAKDGIFSVLGNHDYAFYVNVSDAEKVVNEREIIRLERQFGWDLLLNEHRTIYRGNDSIVIAGMENDGRPKQSPNVDIEKTMLGVTDSALTVMIQHDPSSWKRTILPKSNAQLTLSGHTHGGQFAFLGFSPIMLKGGEINGRYEQDGRTLYVTAGLGALIPFRFGVTGEIVVITLHSAP